MEDNFIVARVFRILIWIVGSISPLICAGTLFGQQHPPLLNGGEVVPIGSPLPSLEFSNLSASKLVPAIEISPNRPIQKDATPAALEKFSADSDSHSNEKPARSDDLASLIEMQRRVRGVLPTVLPCVVSIEGGSGVVVTSDGVILTASHVTEKAGRIINVRFADGRVSSATTLGTNYNTDTGALKLNSPGPWQHLDITDSTVVQTGDWCLALGYPLSFPRGKPAAVRIGRVLKIDANQIVTDCPIMGGDSGGPLLNLNGNLIGISSRVKHDIAENVHVPVQIFIDDWQQLAASVDIRKRSSPTGLRAYLGIQGETDTDRVRIRSVHVGSPAESAGLLAEDVLLQLDGKVIGTFDDVLEILDGRQPGECVVAELNRFGELLSLPIKLGRQY